MLQRELYQHLTSLVTIVHLSTLWVRVFLEAPCFVIP